MEVRVARVARRLPEDSAGARSLARAGVGARDEQAAEAVLLASIPQTARVDKKAVKAPEVQYDGEPKFQPIEQTTVSRAVNTDKDIIKVGDLYYMCFQGVWFMSRAAAGPWEVTGTVPKQIYEIPVSSPSHSVTYVTVEDSSDDCGRVCVSRRLYRRDDRVGLRRLGLGLLLSAIHRLRWHVPLLPPVLSNLRIQCVVQPVDRRLRPWRGRVWTIWRRRGGRSLQPLDRRVFARRGRVGTVRRRGGRRRRTTPEPGPTRAAASPPAPMALAARRKPTTRAPEPTDRHGRDPASTAAGARPA